MNIIRLSIALFIILLVFLLNNPALFAEDDHHRHATEENQHSQHEDDHDDEHGDEHGNSTFGPGKAILEVKNDGQLFKLSTHAEQVMGIKLALPVKSPGKHYFKVPKSSIVKYQEKVGIFRKHDNWYELIKIKRVRTVGSDILIYTQKLTSHDQLAVAGVGLLRVAHLEASGQGGEGHAH